MSWLRVAEFAGAVVVAAVVGSLTLAAVSSLPFEHPGWLPVTVAGTLAAALVVLTAWLLLRRRTGPRTLWLLGTAGPAFLSASHLGLLLHGTPHYLFGLGGDQINRVAYVTRFADSPALADPFYADAAPFYPPQWFWVGGRLAALAGVDGWEFYKPYAIVTMAVAGAIAFVAWRWLVPARVAVLFGLLTAVVGGHTNAYEPYSWILICLLPQIVVATFLLCGRTVRGRPAWPLVVVIGAYLGWAALGYTLIAGVAALLVGLVVLVESWRHRSDLALVRGLLARLAAMAAISAVLALGFWHRYLFAVLGGAQTEASVANDFAPEIASRWPLPMFDVSALGALCLIGVVWIVLTARAGDGWQAVLARACGLVAVTVLGWFAVSGVRAVTGSTLLPFRLIPVITLVLALAGVVGALALSRRLVSAAPGGLRRRATAAAVVVAALAGVQMAQHVSEEDVEFAAAARATGGAPTELLERIDHMTGGRAPASLVVLTADPALYTYRPFFTYQAPAQAYATPAARYGERLEQIRDWSDADSPAALAHAMVSGPFRGPDVLVLDRAAADRWVFPAAVNVMPRTANNHMEEIVFHPGQFSDPDLFEVSRVGSHMVVVRR